ncbi:biotin-dependent carboxyltransferase family protein [Tropicimonas isoalkanivorans]|uniref:Biotin-dependent carboxylase uncharacterized domain-containing protein n=1 Tax=Tropicimonas isoalkanivorans TaxID=441112 RepID=A0A1I1HUF2_9RHOB|nr:biotin-dependent carboxyltransferase family protein [Tropicimonas isoalkanivorans]SFC25578.1 biotin-dependent carboxylase uncharacterized domain-containing protein [Tropicimonas isoalkanivorans]
MIEVLATTPHVTVQDHGRLGHLSEGVPRAGAADLAALAAGNIVLGNPEGLAGIELPRAVISLRFHRHTSIALTGASMIAGLGDRCVDSWTTLSVFAGQVLEIEPRPGGTYSYLTVAGGIDVPLVLGSRSTQLRGSFGGHMGRPLKIGDRLPVGAAPLRFPFCCPIQPPPRVGLAPFRVIPAAEYAYLDPESRADFWNGPWRVTAQCNRAGHRLEGPVLTMKGVPELRSHGIVPGIVQLPNGGQPVVQMCDAATMGGYPKIGTIIDPDLGRFAQISPGSIVRFMHCEASTSEGTASTSDTDWLASLAETHTPGPEADAATLDLLAAVSRLSACAGDSASEFAISRKAPDHTFRLRRDVWGI